MAHTNLLEHILNGNYVSANELFEERMLELQEQKLYEAKRNVAAMYEAEGKYGQYMGKADWAEYRKKHPSLGMYDVPGKKPGTVKKGKPPAYERTGTGGITKKGIEVRKKKGYVQAYPASKAKEFIDKVIHYHKTGEVTEQLQPYVSRLVKGGETAAELGKKADMSAVKASAEKEKDTKPPKDTSGVTSGMRQVLRQKYRGSATKKQYDIKTGETKEVKGKPTTALDLAKRSLVKAVSPGASFKGRVRAVRRAGKAAATMPSVKAAKATYSGIIAPQVSRIASGLAAFEE